MKNRILDKIKGNPFEKLKLDDLKAEKIRLHREEKIKIAEIKELSTKKKELFEKGFKASESERRVLARQIKQFDRKIKLLNIHLKKLSDQIRVVDNMIFIQENRRLLESSGLMKKLSKLPKTRLDEFLAKVNIEDQISTGNIQGIMTTMETEYGLLGESEEDQETKELMDIWASSDIAEVDEIYKKWEEEKAKKERILNEL